MRILLDTHILIWWHENNARLSDRARRVIREAESVFVSMVSAWEAGIKVSKGKLKLLDPIEVQIGMNGFTPLALQFAHIDQSSNLPWHHRDPFDRMLVAQARYEKLYLVTDDKAVLLYDMPRVEI